MPRGGGDITLPSGARLLDDPTAGGQFQAQYGVHSNAEEMILAHRRSVNPALQRASLIPVDQDATEEALADLKGSAAKLKLPEGTELLSCAVHGNALVGVVVDPRNGYVEKVVGGWDDSYSPPKLSPELEQLQAEADAQLKVNHEIARLRSDMEQRIAEAVADATATFQEQLDAASKKAAKETEAAQSASGDDAHGKRSAKPTT